MATSLRERRKSSKYERVMNRLWYRVVAAGLVPRRFPGTPVIGPTTLEVPGKKSGVMRRTPVTWVESGGERYLVAMRRRVGLGAQRSRDRREGNAEARPAMEGATRRAVRRTARTDPAGLVQAHGFVNAVEVHWAAARRSARGIREDRAALACIQNHARRHDPVASLDHLLSEPGVSSRMASATCYIPSRAEA